MKCYAAGVIIFKIEENQFKFLGLKALPYFSKRSNGIYDIPKGKIDPGETPFECAKRECFEESGINVQVFVDGPHIHEGLYLWLAESYQKPKICINPHTKQEEHLGYTWLTGEQIEKDCLNYLQPGIKWARKILKV
tara:strand:- start:918 stop:1325 length:408 start_codon:yes stop_codon:yes gene_type:complete